MRHSPIPSAPNARAWIASREFAQCLAAIFLSSRQNHRAHEVDAIFREEHVLGAAQADSFRSERTRLDGIARNVSIRANAHLPILFRPAHQLLQIRIVRRRRQRVQLALDHASGRSIQRNPVAFLERVALYLQFLVLLVDVQFAGAGDAALAHAARDHRRVRGHAAARSQNASRHFHALDVFRRCFCTYQDDRVLRAVPSLLHRVFGGEHDLTDSRARRCRQTRRQHFDFRALLVETRNQEVIQLVRLHAHEAFFLRDQAFIHHIDGDAHCRQSRTLSVAGLQHVELAFLDGEFEVLHVAVVLLEPVVISRRSLYAPGFTF